MLYHQKPEIFPLDMQVSEGIIEHNGKFLIVRRSQDCSSPGTWSGPGWKLDTGENFDSALTRELKEEIWVDISKYERSVLFHKYFYYLKKNIEICFYKIRCDAKPEIVLNDEHDMYRWVTLEEALQMNLTEDFDKIIKEIYIQ